MKRIAILPAICLLLGLCACGSAEPGADETLQVGYGRVSITPDYPVSMAGSASNRESGGVLDMLYMTCIAFRQNAQTYLVATLDLVGIYDGYAGDVRKAMSQAAGVPEQNIILNGTHTHSSVSANNKSLTGIGQYCNDLNKWATTAAKTAVADLSPAEAWYGSVQADGMAWVRHYELENGTYAGPNFGTFNSAIVDHVTQADTQMQLIKFARSAEDKKDVVLMNFPAHATFNEKSTDLSADFPGPARDYVERNTGAQVAYFIAAAGNQVPKSRIDGESFSEDYRAYGEELGRIAVEGLTNLTKAEGAQVRFCQRTFTAKSNKEGLDRLEQAMAVQTIWDQVGGRGTEKGRQAAKDHGFQSVYEVTAILNRAGFDENRSMELSALAVGDVSMIFAPYEMFGVNGLQIKEGSPYPMTFVASCSSGHQGYLPSEYACQINTYEAQITKFTPGTAEVLVDEYISMLTEMKNQ